MTGLIDVDGSIVVFANEDDGYSMISVMISISLSIGSSVVVDLVDVVETSVVVVGSAVVVVDVDDVEVGRVSCTQVCMRKLKMDPI